MIMILREIVEMIKEQFIMNRDQYVVYIQMRKLRGINLTHKGKIFQCQEWIKKNNLKLDILQKELDKLK